MLYQPSVSSHTHCMHHTQTHTHIVHITQSHTHRAHHPAHRHTPVGLLSSGRIAGVHTAPSCSLDHHGNRCCLTWQVGWQLWVSSCVSLRSFPETSPNRRQAVTMATGLSPHLLQVRGAALLECMSNRRPLWVISRLPSLPGIKASRLGARGVSME